MEKDNDQEYVAAPVMDVSDQLTEQHVALQMDDGVVGIARHGLVDKFKHEPCDE